MEGEAARFEGIFYGGIMIMTLEIRAGEEGRRVRGSDGMGDSSGSRAKGWKKPKDYSSQCLG